MTEIVEIAPGVFHWKAVHPKIKIEVSSYCVADARALIDPMLPAEGLDWFRDGREPERILLTNRHHLRDSERFAGAFGCPILCHRAGLHEFEGGPEVKGFEYGDEVAPGITVHEVGSICPDDAALHIQAGPGLLAFADGLIRVRDQLGFVPDQYMDDPERTKAGIVESLRRLLELDFDGLLFAHGEPLVGGGKDALREFVELPRTVELSG